MSQMPDHSPVTSEVASLDAAGRHDDALSLLARATGAGDLVAMTHLGKRLLVGDKAPYLPNDGASMVLEAARKGLAEAIASVAIFQCIGIYQDKNWHQALATLARAADLGWRPAREQLLLLSNAPEAGDHQSLLARNTLNFWLDLARTVDIESWCTAPAAAVLNDSPQVVSFDAFIPPDWCRFFIRLAAGRLKPALVYDSANRLNFRSKTRSNSIAEFNLVENTFVHFLLQERMSNACGIPMVHMEGAAILNYKPGEEISNHYDFVDPDLPHYQQEIERNGQRIITFLVYLNDDYSNGETEFPVLGIRHKGKTGEGLYFVNALPDGSADKRSLHAGAATGTGQKWIVSQFIRNRPVKYVL